MPLNLSMAERLPNPIDVERVVLAPLRVSDAEEMVAVLSSPGLYVYIGRAADAGHPAQVVLRPGGGPLARR